MICLFTDFGLHGPYTGQVKAILARLAPASTVVIDLVADAPACRPDAAAYLLAAYAARFAAGTVFLAVVDPGVGGDRLPCVVQADRRWYVGPDNGLFELVLRRAAVARAWRIDWRPPDLSASFHGRDLFAPVAARLLRGLPPGAALPVAALRRADWPDDLGRVIYQDRYGNAMTGLRAAAVPASATLVAGGRRLARARTFDELPPGEAFWYENANGLIEIAVNRGHAAELLQLAIGTPVAVEVSP